MEKPSEISSRIARPPTSLRAVAAGLIALGTLLATSPMLPMGWDEGNAIGRAQKIGDWVGSWFQQGPAERSPLGREAIAEHWPYTTQIEGHPAFYGIVIAAGHSLGQFFLPPLTAWRLGPMLLFAVAAGAMFYRVSRSYGQAAGWATAAALLLQPRLFAHAHFATCDGVLTACWVLAWVVFVGGCRSPRCEGQEEGKVTRPRLRFHLVSVLFGVVLGMTMSAKATGWIAPLPFVLWAGLYRDRRAGGMLAIGLPVALATFYALNPPLWHDPIRGLITFFQLNTNRQLNVANFFLGHMYDLHHSLPWYNTLVWTAIAVPVGLLLFALLGLVSIVRRGLADRVGILLILNWLILLVIRALPGTPPHDGIRLFLPAFGFLAAIVGVGAGACATACLLSSAVNQRRDSSSTKHCQASRQWHTIGRKQWFTLTLISLVFLGSATSLFWYAPQWLSYYNLAIGGLPGATRAGMEPTYYWDSLDGEVLDWLDANTADGEKVWFGSGSGENLALMRQWGTLPVEFRPEAPGRYRWYVIQRRPSACMPPDQWLLQHAEPVYKKYIHRHGLGPWRLNVPILEIYRYEDFVAAVEASSER